MSGLGVFWMWFKVITAYLLLYTARLCWNNWIHRVSYTHTQKNVRTLCIKNALVSVLCIALQYIRLKATTTTIHPQAIWIKYFLWWLMPCIVNIMFDTWDREHRIRISVCNVMIATEMFLVFQVGILYMESVLYTHR